MYLYSYHGGQSSLGSNPHERFSLIAHLHCAFGPAVFSLTEYAPCSLSALWVNFSICYRDLVHRQTTMSAIQHMALGVFGFGCEDALTHLMNHVWPNVFESSPHVVQAFMGAIEGMRVGLGPSKVLQYALQVGALEKFNNGNRNQCRC